MSHYLTSQCGKLSCMPVYEFFYPVTIHISSGIKPEKCTFVSCQGVYPLCILWGNDEQLSSSFQIFSFGHTCIIFHCAQM